VSSYERDDGDDNGSGNDTAARRDGYGYGYDGTDTSTTGWIGRLGWIG
jgi:hypothetical protein